MTLAIQWTQGVPAERKKEVQEAIRNSTIAITQLRKIIHQRLEELQTKVSAPPSTIDYATHQAYLNGGIKELSNIDQLLGFIA